MSSSNRHQTYKQEGWQGYGHWLGTSNLVGGKLDFLPFKDALVHARALKLKGVQEWEAWRKSGVRPANVPSRPDQIYKDDGQRWCAQRPAVSAVQGRAGA